MKPAVQIPTTKMTAMTNEMLINWDDPEERSILADRIGLEAFNEAFSRHIKQSSVATIAGQNIRPVGSRFGKLWQVGNTGRAFSTREQAETYARDNPSIEDDYDD